jgi:hypothetical protein
LQGWRKVTTPPPSAGDHPLNEVGSSVAGSPASPISKNPTTRKAGHHGLTCDRTSSTPQAAGASVHLRRRPDHLERPPPIGTHTWEGKSRWGVWYATAELTDERYAYFAEQAKALDAREIVAVTNADVLELAEQVRAAKGSPYGLAAYVAAMDSPAEAAAAYAASLGLPWAAEGDTTADDKLKEYDA